MNCAEPSAIVGATTRANGWPSGGEWATIRAALKATAVARSSTVSVAVACSGIPSYRPVGVMPRYIRKFLYTLI